MSHIPLIPRTRAAGEVIAVAMSGGVDSSVAAALLVRQGHPVVGITLQMWSDKEAAEDRAANTCRACHAVTDARSVAKHLGIPHFTMEAGTEFEREVAEPFCAAYLCGLTPNPCLPCNARLKFGALLDRARGLGAPRLATGHYARSERDAATGRFLLRRARDLQKDQSYFLAGLNQAQLAAALFPLGGLAKADTRRIAAEFGLPVADKPESQEVCFAAGDYRRYLQKRAPEAFRPGAIRDRTGAVLGRHGGLALYTVGQRHGLGLGSQRPYYVIRLDAANNEIVVGNLEDLAVREIAVEGLNLIALPALDGPRRVRVKVRSAGQAVAATIRPTAPGSARVVFETPQRAVAPGQAAVFFDAAWPELVLGSGTICPRSSA